VKATGTLVLTRRQVAGLISLEECKRRPIRVILSSFAMRIADFLLFPACAE
jgi:hypothetical protein